MLDPVKGPTHSSFELLERDAVKQLIYPIIGFSNYPKDEREYVIIQTYRITQNPSLCITAVSNQCLAANESFDVFAMG